MIYTVTLNPALDKTVIIENFQAGKVNRIKEARKDPGGKGINVSKAAAMLGAATCAAGILGGNTGREIESLLEGELEDRLFIYTDGESRINMKVTDPVTGDVTDINEPGPEYNEKAVNELKSCLMQRIKPGDIVILSGRLPNKAPEDTYRKWTEELKTRGVLVAVDAEGETLKEALKAGPWLVKPNDVELSKYMGKELHSVEEILQGAHKIIEDGAENAVISLGSEGSLFIYEGETVLAEGLKVPVISTVGAGDCMVAAIAFSKTKGLNTDKTARLAAAVSAAKVMCSGSQAPDIREVNRLEKTVITKYLK